LFLQILLYYVLVARMFVLLYVSHCESIQDSYLYSSSLAVVNIRSTWRVRLVSCKWTVCVAVIGAAQPL